MSNLNIVPKSNIQKSSETVTAGMDNAVLNRLINEIRVDETQCHPVGSNLYDRTYNRHNR